MINRNEIESILKINGVKPTSPDEQIRSVLLSARYSKDEVDTAIMVLRENIKTNKTRVDGLHKIFRTDEGLKPHEVSQLLGINIDVTHLPSQVDKNREIPLFHMIFIGALAVFIAILGVLFYMYMYRIGIFHPTVGMAFFNEL